MNFNVQLKALAVAACALLAACNSLEVEMPNLPDNNPTVESSEPISFSAEKAITRTTFGEVADNVVPIYWANGDHITLYCAEASNTQTEDIELTGCENNDSAHEATTTTMTWSSASQHNFYAAYPATTISAAKTINFTMPSMQTTSGSAAPDMKLAKMVAAHENVSNTDRKVNLPFTPAFSVLDITFTASESVTISRIVVSSTDGTPVAGDYTASFNGSKWTFNTTTDATKRSSLMAIQINGTAGITLAAGATARFYAFLLPVEYAGLRVDLLTPDGKVVGRSTQNVTFGAAKRYGINLGTLPASSAWKSTYGTWMKYIPDNVLVSDLSIPGTHDAATSSVSGLFSSKAKCQSLTIANQLPIGVRAFDLRPAGDFNLYHSTYSTGVSWAGAMSAMFAYMDSYPTEGCITIIRNESEKSSWDNSKVAPYLQENGQGRLVNFKKNLTVGELRGKILIMSRNTYDNGPIGGYIGNWSDNESEHTSASFYIGSESETLWLQDNYNSASNASNKATIVNNMVTKCKSKPINTWMINHASFAGSLLTSPESNAKTINPSVVSHINNNPGNVGIIPMDYAGNSGASGDQLVNAVINQNVRYAQGIK